MLFLVKTENNKSPVIVGSTELKDPCVMLLEVCKKHNVKKIYDDEEKLLEAEEGFYMISLDEKMKKYKMVEVMRCSGYIYGCSIFIEDRFKLHICDYEILDSDDATDDVTLTMRELMLKVPLFVGKIESHN